MIELTESERAFMREVFRAIFEKNISREQIELMFSVSNKMGLYIFVGEILDDLYIDDRKLYDEIMSKISDHEN